MTKPPTLPKSVLAVAVDRPELASIEAMLARAVLAVYRVAGAAEAFEPLDTREFGLVMIGHPLPDARLDDFLSFLRRPGGGNARTPVLVLSEGRPPPAGDELAYPWVELVSFARPRTAALTELSRHLGVAPRQHHRALVQLQVEVDDRTERRALQTENISETGMLVRTRNPYPVTTRLELKIDLPADGSRCETGAIVVRHAENKEGEVVGMGLRFVGMTEADADRLGELLESTAGRPPRGG